MCVCIYIYIRACFCLFQNNWIELRSSVRRDVKWQVSIRPVGPSRRDELCPDQSFVESLSATQLDICTYIHMYRDMCIIYIYIYEHMHVSVYSFDTRIDRQMDR